MAEEKKGFLRNLFDPEQWTLVNLLQALGAIAGVIALFYTVASPIPLLLVLSLFIVAALGIFLFRWWKRWRTESVLRKLPPEFYAPGTIRFSTQYYLPPFCSEKDPTQADKDDLKKIPKKKLFKFIDDFLSNKKPDRFMTLLGDSGTGKTSFVLNYYARNQRRWWKRLPIRIIPLGVPEVEKHISAIENKNETVLFLDGFDEDTKAFENPGERLQQLWECCRDFRRLVITCRTQFFSSDEALPRETPIRYHGPKAANMPGVYRNLIRYLMPFEDKQVKQYLRLRYPFWHWNTRRKAFRTVRKIPRLSMRPMLLAYIPDLLDKDYRYTFELYEEMVNAWLQREKGVLPGVTIEALREFSERLAVDLYVNSEDRGATRIHYEQLEPLAQRWNILLNKWEMTSRSLLNRDAGGYYKFAHRSIMEFLFVKRFLKWDDQTRNISWSDQIQTFLWETLPLLRQRGELLPFSLDGVNLNRYNVEVPIQLRNEPIENKLSDVQVKEMLRKHNFFDINRYKIGKGLAHDYRSYNKEGERVLIDFKTNLMWQKSGTKEGVIYKKAREYINQLNKNQFAGYHDWRLPTLEEAMSLIETAQKEGCLYINPLFDKTQQYIWTSDFYNPSHVWRVNFNLGGCFRVDTEVNDTNVRAVRSGRSLDD